jgi:hypothetical protein
MYYGGLTSIVEELKAKTEKGQYGKRPKSRIFLAIIVINFEIK